MAFLDTAGERRWFINGLVVMGRMNNYDLPEPLTDDNEVESQFTSMLSFNQVYDPTEEGEADGNNTDR